jgi:hypothetical protein
VTSGLRARNVLIGEASRTRIFRDRLRAQRVEVRVPPAAKSETESALRGYQGLSTIAGKRVTVTLSVRSGNIVALGVRFNHAAFTSIPAVGNRRRRTAGNVRVTLPLKRHTRV